MKLETLWIVKNATKHSTLEDCLFQQEVARVDLYVLGSPRNAWRTEAHTVYTTREEALADAKERLTRAGEAEGDQATEESWERAIATAAHGPTLPDDAPAHEVISRFLGEGVERRFDAALRAAKELKRDADTLVRKLMEDGVGAVTSGNGYGGSARKVTECLAELGVAREAFGTAYRAAERTSGR